MATAINTAKNTASPSNLGKHSQTWDEATYTWDSPAAQVNTWDSQVVAMTNVSKNAVSPNNLPKN